MLTKDSIALNESRSIWWRYPRLLALPAVLAVTLVFFAIVTALRVTRKAALAASQEAGSRSVELVLFLAELHLFALWLATGHDYLGRAQLKEEE